MGKNPVIPYILIFSLGIGLIFFMSLYGLEQKQDIASQDENGKTDEVAVEADFDGAVAQGKCIGCHGGSLEGGMGGAAPGLVGTSLSKDEIAKVIIEGKGSMPPGIIPAEQADAMAEYILSLK